MTQGGPGQVLLLARADDYHKVARARLVLDLQAGHFGNCDAKAQPQFDTKNLGKGPLCKLPKTSLARGARCDGPPGPRPHFSPTYYAAFLFDPDGHRLEVVHQ